MQGKTHQHAALKDEVIGIAKEIGAMSAFKLLVIDTENTSVSTCMSNEVAFAAGRWLHYIPKASANAMKQVNVEADASLEPAKSDS